MNCAPGSHVLLRFITHKASASVLGHSLRKGHEKDLFCVPDHNVSSEVLSSIFVVL
jgi:hypothetical protein